MSWEVPIMKAASILSPGLLKSSLKRFWPLWLAGLVGLVLLFDVPMYSTAAMISKTASTFAEKQAGMDSAWGAMGLLAWAYAMVGAPVVAIALNEHLFDMRSATFIGSLPIRRKSVYVTMSVLGLVVLLAIPAVAVALLLPLRVSLGALLSLGTAAEWYASVALSVLVLYAVATVSCQLSGTRPVALLLYLVMGFLASCLEAAVRLVVSSLMYGMSESGYMLEFLSPAVWLGEVALTWVGNIPTINATSIACYVVASLLAMAFAGWIFCRRDLEAASSSVAVASLRPVLKYLAGFSSALLFSSVYRLTHVSDAFSGLPMKPGEVATMTVFMVIGGFIGTLFAENVMRRSTHGLAHSWRAAVVVGAVSVAFVGACWFDVFGVAHYVPEPGSVERVMLEGGYGRSFELTSPEGIAAACELQRDVIANGGEGNSDDTAFDMVFAYHLADGREVWRRYPIPTSWFEVDGQSADPKDASIQLIDRFAELANSPEGRASRFASVLEADPAKLDVVFEYLVEDDGSYYATVTIPADEREDLLEALRIDLMEEDAGLFSNQNLWDDEGYDGDFAVNKQSEVGLGSDYLFSMQLNDASCPHTVEWLKKNHPEIKLLRLKSNG